MTDPVPSVPVPEVSLVVSTLDRVDDLARLLESVERARAFDGAACEIVVVDNGSTDETGATCRAWVARDPGAHRYVVEPRRGKSVALNTGVAVARGGVLAFTDDDCLVDETWLAEIRRAFADDPDLGLLGGRVELHDPRDLPITLVTVTERVAVESLDAIFPTPLVIGANMAIRREALARIGRFDEAMGPGTSAIAEDADIVFRALRAGVKAVYTPDVRVRHNHGRRDPAVVERLNRVYRVGRGAFLLKHTVRGDRAAARLLAADLWDAGNRAVGRGADGPSPGYLLALLEGAGRRLAHDLGRAMRLGRGSGRRRAAAGA